MESRDSEGVPFTSLESLTRDLADIGPEGAKKWSCNHHEIENLHTQTRRKIHRFQKCFSFRSTTKNDEIVVEKPFQNSGITRCLAVLNWRLSSIHPSSYYYYYCKWNKQRCFSRPKEWKTMLGRSVVLDKTVLRTAQQKHKLYQKDKKKIKILQRIGLKEKKLPKAHHQQTAHNIELNGKHRCFTSPSPTSSVESQNH